MRRPYVPELFLGLLSLAIGAVWIGHMVSATIHDARHTNDTITITGSARVPIGSNLAEWSVRVDGIAATPTAAARKLRRESAQVVAFLRGTGIRRQEIAPQVVQSETIVTRIDKHHVRTTYRVSQGLDVTTPKLDVVQGAATQLGELLERGVTVSAEPLQFVSTRLANAKLDALAEATGNARRRADILVKGLGGKVGGLRASSLGVYQIVPRNSTAVSDYGVDDTSSRSKDVVAVVSATFAVRR
jgi:uncharacterized protein